MEGIDYDQDISDSYSLTKYMALVFYTWQTGVEPSL